MKHSFVATLAESREVEFSLEPLGNGQYRYQRGETTLVIDARRIGGSPSGRATWSIVRPGRADLIDVMPNAGGVEIQTNEHVILAQIVDAGVARRRRLQSGTTPRNATGPAEIKSPMPGKIVKLLVGVGDSVTVGQGVIVVEAMKMENELRATRAGQVAAILVRETQAVDAGQVVLRIEPVG